MSEESQSVDAETAAADAARTIYIVARAVEQLPVAIAVRERSTGRLVYGNDAFSAQTAEAIVPGGSGVPAICEQVGAALTVAGTHYDVSASIAMTEHHRREAELTKRAFYDDLTSLPKRDLFERTVSNMIAEGCAPFALAFIDVDNFKYVNDYYGHAVGDQLLKKIARRIGDCLRPTDLLARVGGDEFVLLMTPIGDHANPTAEIDHVAARFREPFFIDGYEVFSSASIGVSLYPVHGQDYGPLRANADNAMYRIKGTTKGAVSLYDASLGYAATQRMETEQRLRLAIRDRRLHCAFQPKVDFRTDEILGVEVLLRWLDENGDFRPPGDFIKVAIELGLMDDIALLVLDQVVGQIDLINEAFGPNASISLNIAAKQATDLAFMEKFADALAATGYASRFILELTEEAFLSKGDFQRTILPMVHAIGAKVSIDDFGVGYSSLSALAEITADELKVDRSFITDIHKKPRNQSILRVIELLGQSLGMRVVVEGVETFEELTYLTVATHINCAQGYYFAKPLVLQPSGRAPMLAERRAAGVSREPLRARGAGGRF